VGPPTAGFDSTDDEDDALVACRPVAKASTYQFDDDTDDDAPVPAPVPAPVHAPAPSRQCPPRRRRHSPPPAPAPPPPAPAPPPPAAPPPPTPAQVQAQREAALLVRLDEDAREKEMAPLLLAAYNGDAAAVGPLLRRGEPYDQSTARNNQNVLHLAAGPGDERLAFVVAFLGAIGFESGMQLALQNQKDGVAPFTRARMQRHRRVAELFEALARGDRQGFAGLLDAARNLVQFEPQSPPSRRPRAPVVARWVGPTTPPPRRRRRAPSPESSDDDSAELGPTVPAAIRRAPRPIPEGQEIIEIE